MKTRKHLGAARPGPEHAFAIERDPRWLAVLRRDRSADGMFFYSVKTTGVYCRPTCAARQPNPRNVKFHPTREDAERAGFRPCRRCRPDALPAGERQAARIAEVCRLIDRASEIPPLEILARRAGLSPHHFHRVFKAVTGLTPRAYAAARRAEHVRQQLKRSTTVTEAIYDAGFNSGGRFYESSNAILGMTPSAFRAGGADAEIRFAVGQCAVGHILVAASTRGVCAILLGDDPDLLVRSLQDQFPRATLVGGDAAFERVVATVIAFVEAPATGLHLPLDIRGTAFQRRVWQALRDIPAGATATYAEIAARIGSPASARAVAQACAANRLAVAIPCHRVVRTDGSLSGYRWGIDRKRGLLVRESTAHA